MSDAYEIVTLLNRIADMVHSWAKVSSSCGLEKIGRAFTLFGTTCVAAEHLKKLEEELNCTLLNPYQINYVGLSAQVQGVIAEWNYLISDADLHKNRDFNRYPVVTMEKLPKLLERYKCLELLPSGKIGDLSSIDIVDCAYNMSDIILLALGFISNKLDAIFNDYMELEKSIEKRIQRWSNLERVYITGRWVKDRQIFLEKLEDHINQYGNTKSSLEKFLKKGDRKALNQKSALLVELNERFLNQDCFLKFVYEHRNKLSREDLSDHLSYRFCRKMILQKIDLLELQKPAIGVYSNLFTSRAAQELAELLVPTIATYVDFKYGYQYAALTMVMMDLGLIFADKRNGAEQLAFVNQHFLKNDNQIKRQNLITDLVNKKGNRKFGELSETDLVRTSFSRDEYQKLKDIYWHCLSIINQVLQKDLKSLGFAPYLYIEHPNTPAIVNYCLQAKQGFISRLQLLKTAFD